MNLQTANKESELVRVKILIFIRESLNMNLEFYLLVQLLATTIGLYFYLI